jgi:hypothetical protein
MGGQKLEGINEVIYFGVNWTKVWGPKKPV